MAKNKRKALSAIEKNIVKSPALDLKPSNSNRVNSKARASDVFEPRSKNRIQYVQIIKDPKNKLYKAIVDEGTNGIYFYPSSSSKTPMAFDKKRHVIVYGDVPQTSCTVGNIKSTDVEVREQENSPSNSSSFNSDNFSDDDSFKVGDDIQNLKAKKVKVTQAKKQSASTRVNISRKMTDLSMKGNQCSDSDKSGGEADDGAEGSASPSPPLNSNKGGRNNRESTRGSGSVRFCNIPDNAASLYEADWRTMGAIDY